MRKEPPPRYIVHNHRRYEYVRAAELDKDGGCWLSQLADDECVVAPGWIYRLE